MSLKRLQHLSLCFASALLLTVAAVALDSQRAGVHRTMSALQWARQVASQTEGMVFKAKEQGERDPISWAVNYLSQGVEPRLVRIQRVRVEDLSAQANETFTLNREAGVFDYTRILTPEDGSGVHIQLVLGYSGFLGTHSALAADFLVLVFFSMCFAVIFLRTGRYFGFDDARRLRALVSRWVASAKSQLTLHGTHVREMVRQSQRMAVCAGKSRDHVAQLRERIHSGLSELHESRDFYREGDSIAKRAETLALNMAIEANRLGGDARRIADMATELHRRLQAMHEVNRKGQSLVQLIERQVEPWATDADLAYHAFDGVREATMLLGQHIRSTTESLAGQAKLIQNLDADLGLPEDQQRGEDRAEAEAAGSGPALGGGSGSSGARRVGRGLKQALGGAGGGARRAELEAPRGTARSDGRELEAPDAGDEELGMGADGDADTGVGMSRLPDPLPPISEKAQMPRIARKIRIIQRKIRQKKSA